MLNRCLFDWLNPYPVGPHYAGCSHQPVRRTGWTLNNVLSEVPHPSLTSLVKQPAERAVGDGQPHGQSVRLVDAVFNLRTARLYFLCLHSSRSWHISQKYAIQDGVCYYYLSVYTRLCSPWVCLSNAKATGFQWPPCPKGTWQEKNICSQSK